MQKTYSELFNLQNLLEKTVRHVAVSNNLKSAVSNEAASAAATGSTGRNAKATGGASGGRPYYPGSPVKVRTEDSATRPGAAAAANADAKKAKKDTPDVQPQEKSNGGRMSPFQKLVRKEFKYPGQQQLDAEMQNLERLQRMTELWGSPDGGAGGNFLRSPSPRTKRSDAQVTPGRKSVGSRDVVPANNMQHAASNRLHPSPRTPTASSASFIPRLISPPAVINVLNAAHAAATLTPSKGGASPKTPNRTAGVAIASNPASSRAGAKSLQAKQDDHVTAASGRLQSPSTLGVRLISTAGPSPSKDALVVTRAVEAEPSRESFRRSGEGLMSSEDLELQVLVDVVACCLRPHKFYHSQCQSHTSLLQTAVHILPPHPSQAPASSRLSSIVEGAGV